MAPPPRRRKPRAGGVWPARIGYTPAPFRCHSVWERNNPVGAVRFLSGEQCQALTRKLGFDCRGPVNGHRAARHLKVFDALYDSRIANGPEVAEALVEHQGAYATCLVWACGLPFGDQSQEGEPRSDWKRFRDWRRREGEWRTVYDAPGHLFEGHERAALAKLIEWALYMGWDALVAAAPGKGAVLLSHDD